MHSSPPPLSLTPSLSPYPLQSSPPLPPPLSDSLYLFSPHPACVGAITVVQNWCANNKNGVTLFVPPNDVYSNDYDVVTGDQSKIKTVSQPTVGDRRVYTCRLGFGLGKMFWDAVRWHLEVGCNSVF